MGTANGLNGASTPTATSWGRAEVVVDYWRQKNSGVEEPAIYALGLGLGPITDDYGRQWIESNTVNPNSQAGMGQTRYAVKTITPSQAEWQPFGNASGIGGLPGLAKTTSAQKSPKLIAYFHDYSSYLLLLKPGELSSITATMASVRLDAGQTAFNQVGRTAIKNCNLNTNALQDLNECRRKAVADCTTISTEEEFLSRLKYHTSSRFIMTNAKVEKTDQFGKPWMEALEDLAEGIYNVIEEDTKLATLEVLSPSEPDIVLSPLIDATKTLSYGSIGEDVELLQRALNENGAGLKVDGIFGKRTEQEVKDYQGAQDIAADGKVDRQTWETLVPSPPAGLDLSNVEEKSLTLSWEKSVRSETYAVYWDECPYSNTAETCCDVKELSGGRLYAFHVRAINAVGMSKPSETVVAFTKPSAPKNLEVHYFYPVKASHYAVLLTWDETPGAAFYTLYMDGSQNKRVMENRCIAEIVEREESYPCYVVAMNSTGESDKSETLEVGVKTLRQPRVKSEYPLLADDYVNLCEWIRARGGWAAKDKEGEAVSSVRATLNGKTVTYHKVPKAPPPGMVTYIDEDFLVWCGEPWIDVFVLWKDFYDVDLYGIRGLPSKDMIFISQLVHPDAGFNQQGSEWAFDYEKAYGLLQEFKKRQQETLNAHISGKELAEMGYCESGSLSEYGAEWLLNTMFQRSLSSETMLTLAMEDYQKWMQNVQISFALAFVDAMNTDRRMENFTENNQRGKSNYTAAKIKPGNVDDLPPNAKEAYNGYEGNGWKGNYNGQYPGTRAGGTYKNSNTILPPKDFAGNPITYKEFDINAPAPGIGRDMERFVVGSDGSVYYTDSHYGQGISPAGLPPFVKIK